MKIALVALSGIRVCDPELMRLGFTLPGFVERGQVIASLPSLSLLTLAGMTPAKHEVAYLEARDLGSSGVPEGFDVAAISTLSAQVPEAYGLADRCRSAGMKVVLGGLHVTALPEEALHHADAVVVGEGETVWPRLLESLEAGHAEGIIGDRSGSFSLADAPLPAFHLLDTTRYNRLTVQTSRGCPHHCEFCASSILTAPRFKTKPISKVLAEVDAILEIWDRPFVELADDNSFVNRPYWKELLPSLARREVRWFTETDLSVAEDDRLLHLARRAGCVEVLIGFESPTREPLHGLELRRDWKLQRWGDYRDAIRRIQSHGIRVNACFILGLDGQAGDCFDEVREFVDEATPFDVQITVQTAFPGTPLRARLKQEGRLLGDGDWERCTLFDIGFKPKRMTVDQLREGFKKLATDLYGEERTRRRREGFRRHARKVLAVQ
ncbi:MAG: radical SAM protein [Acidobacteria bacterium]|nr:radical SAM protein [Acidobacteriota bacterium]NIM60428.1 radical SAM protein [Acidobacteriota bacterium]NIO58603.1 radical SAM protein [Acidobacteriota bacterium]NIQ29655.1 radical SAM protein [Acidobacteriota bacterium]NIQ84372.1 radical SAM protein [Acidobacteriota bacterium]